MYIGISEKIIVSNENEFNNRLEYGKEVLKGLSTETYKIFRKRIFSI